MIIMEEYLKQVKSEVFDIDTKTGWNTLYQAIRHESLNYNYPCGEAKVPANKLLNRYRDVSPFDHSRVTLTDGPCNYINASLVKVCKAGRNYILTQGPLPQTAGHFWLMIWEQKSRAILMLNKVIEKNQVKCHQYWPVGSKNGGADTMDFSDVGLSVRLISEEESRHFVIRTLSIQHIATGTVQEVLQFHYTTWPDFGVPSTPRAFLHFLQVVRDSDVLNSDVGPPIVHCSAGIGRSGTFCLVDSSLLMMERNMQVNVKDVLLEMRKFRMGLIQTSDQLRFSYITILEGIQQLADGKQRFMPDDEENGVSDLLDERPAPLPPRRTDSLVGEPLPRLPPSIHEAFLKTQLYEKPLPQVPLSDESSDSDDDSDDSLIQDLGSGSDSLDDDEDIQHNDDTLPIAESIEDIDRPNEDESSHNNQEEELNNSHLKTNGVEANEGELRRRKKQEDMMNKIREIKQHQKESEIKKEIKQHIIRSPKPKRRKRNDDDDEAESKAKMEGKLTG